MLSHDFYYPDYPLRCDHPGVSKRRDRWQREAVVLWLLSQGFSLRTEIEFLLARLDGTNRHSGALRQVIPGMRQSQLVETDTAQLVLFSRRTRLSLVRLTEQGEDLCRTLGWEPRESEWERMQRLHEKASAQIAHTAAVLAFVYHARLRGWSAGVIPEVDEGRFYPDATVSKGGESFYVEVELSEGKLPKWYNMAKAQGVIALCARNPGHRKRLVAEVEAATRTRPCPILATDLRTLFVDADADLWLLT